MNLKKFSLLLVVFVGLAGIYRYLQPIAAVPAVITIASPATGTSSNLPWPNYGQGALAAQGYGLLETHGEQKPVPMASIAKLVTALAVLKQKPLQKGQSGPNIIIDKDDVAAYDSYYSQDGSVVKVELGEQISEYQALQALLIPSANNMADTLARWAFGSMEKYVTYANQMLQGLSLQGLSLQDTKVADASGFSSQSVSSAEDLARLGLAVMENPLLEDVVSQESADIPVAGTVNNLNWLLGEDGVIGIKTGNTDQAGGCYLFASQRVINGQSVTVIGTVMGAPDRNQAISDSRAILRSIDSSFELVVIARKDQVIGYYQVPWGARSEIAAKEDLSILAYRGADLKLDKQIEAVKSPALSGKQTGIITVSLGQQTKSVPVVLKNNLAGPGWRWRIFR